MLRFLDDLCNVTDGDGVGAKYTTINQFSQAGPITGRDGFGFAYWMFNATFGALNHSITLEDVVEPCWWAADIAFYNSGTQTTIQFNAEIWQAGNFHTGIICSMLIDLSGFLHFRLGTNTGGPTPVDLAVSSNQFPVSSSAIGQQPIFGKLEVQVGSGAFEVHYEGNKIMEGGSGALTGIDTFVWRSPNQNWAIQNHYILDSNGGLSGFLGGSRIDSILVGGTVAPDQWNPIGSGSIVTAVSEHGPGGHYPDGDTTYIQPNAMTGSLQFFKFNRPSCYGLIYALGVMACCAPEPGLPQAGAYVRPKVTLFPIGLPQTVTDSGGTIEPGYPPMFGYRTYQFLTETIPGVGDVWNDGAIGAAEWGLKSENSTAMHCTQFYLAKLVSTDPSQKFTCGGVGNYVW